MGALDILMGTLFFAAPHLGGVGANGLMTWYGLFRPLELAAAVLGTILFSRCHRIPFREVSLIAAVGTVLLVLVATVSGTSSFLVPLESFVRTGGVVAWVLWANQRASVLENRTHDLVPMLLFVSGITGQLALAATRASFATWTMPQHVSLYVAAFAAALPFCVLLCRIPFAKNDFVLVSVMPTLGSLLGDRICAYLSSSGMTSPFVVIPPALLSIAPLFSTMALTVAWMTCGSVEASYDGEPSEWGEARKPSRAPTWGRVLGRLEGYETLSGQEQRVLELTLGHHTAREIADEMRIAPSTVSSYRTRAYQKLGAGSLRELTVTLALRMRIISHVPQENERAPRLRECIVARDVRIVLLSVLFLVSLKALSSSLDVRIIFDFLQLFLLVGGLWGLFGRRASRTEARFSSLLIGTLFGVSGAILAATILQGAWLYLPIVALCTALLMLGMCVQLRTVSNGAPETMPIFFAALGITGFSLIPQTATFEALSRIPLLLISCAACMQVAGLLAVQHERMNQAALVADSLLQGEERVLAYLRGRGVRDLQARVILLTAYGFERRSVADALNVSPSTVSTYRTRAYQALGVHGRQELRELLERDAGFYECGVENGDAS